MRERHRVVFGELVEYSHTPGVSDVDFDETRRRRVHCKPVKSMPKELSP